MSVPYVPVDFISTKFDEIKLAEKTLAKKSTISGVVRYKKPADKRRFTIESNPSFEIIYCTADGNEDKSVKHTFHRSSAECATILKVSTGVIYRAVKSPRVNIDGQVFKIRTVPITIVLTVEENDGSITTHTATCDNNKEIAAAKKALADSSKLPVSRINEVYKLFLGVSSQAEESSPE